MPDMWSDENVDDCESENRIPTGSTSAFMERMTVDVAKRQNEKQINELRKTVEGRNMLRKLGYQVEKPKRGVKPPETFVNPLTGNLPKPKIVTHSAHKVNDKKLWDRAAWSKNTWMF